MQNVLVTDTQTQLGFNIMKAFLADGMTVIAAPTETEPARTYDPFKKKSLTVIPWNRSSAISTKNLVVKSLHQADHLDAAFILQISPTTPPGVFRELKALDIEQHLDISLKGTLLLVRELYGTWSSQKRGALIFITLSRKTEGSIGIVDDICQESILTLMNGLAPEAKTRHIACNTFQSRTEDQKAYAHFIVTTFREKCYKTYGKVFSYQWR